MSDSKDDSVGINTDDAVRVFIRVRPLNKREKNLNETFAWSYNKTSLLEETQNGQRVYAYDRCYGPDDRNALVYKEVGQPTVLKCMEGYNGTVFTYGQTGSGKTYSMRGMEDDPGMMMLCIKDIFDWIEEHKEREYRLRVSYMEVYNEEINDLLGDGSPMSKNLKIVSEDNVKGAAVGNLTELPVANPAELMQALQKGEESRSYGSTAMNAESSRSHTIYRLIIEIREKEGEGGDDDGEGELRLPSEQGKEREPLCTTYLNLVDLAGSERQKSTGTSGSALKEGANINKSLLALGAVINKLGEASKKTKKSKETFIPFRDSKLTRILKSSLGGNCLTSIICAISPASGSREETVSTLKFGQVCKSIKNKAQSNEVMDEKGQIRMLKKQVEELKKQLGEAEEKIASGGMVSNVNLDDFMSSMGGEGGQADAGGANGDMVPAAVLRQAMMEKATLNDRLKVYEGLLGSIEEPEGEGEGGEGGEGDEEGGDGSSGGDKPKTKKPSKPIDIQSLINDLVSAKKEIREQEDEMRSLKGILVEFGDLEEAKALSEEEKQEALQGLSEESERIAREREHLYNDRSTIMKEREAMDEKESRLGMLLSALDERDSKLRQHMSMIQDQKKQWEASVKDLRRREELVMDWQLKHSARETRLRERDEAYDAKLRELGAREKTIMENEAQVKIERKQTEDLDHRVQGKLSKCMAKETELEEEMERVRKVEFEARAREEEMEMKERELVFKARELEGWDAMLREKDDKLLSDLTANDTREKQIYESESRIREMEGDLRESEHRISRRESEVAMLVEKYTRGLDDVVSREKAVEELDRKLHRLDEDLSNKEVELSSKEAMIKSMSIRLDRVDEREGQLSREMEELERSRDHFYENEVAGITKRHGQEMAELEDLVAQQLKTVTNFQSELEQARADIAARMEDNESLTAMLEERDKTVTVLKGQLEDARVEQEKLLKDARHLASRAGRDGPASGQNGADLGSFFGLDTLSAGRRRHRGSVDSVGFDDVGFDDGDEDDIGVRSVAQVAAPKRSFLVQLAETQKMLERVLEVHGKEISERDSSKSHVQKRRVSLLSREQMAESKAKREANANRGARALEDTGEGTGSDHGTPGAAEGATGAAMAASEMTSPSPMAAALEKAAADLTGTGPRRTSSTTSAGAADVPTLSSTMTVSFGQGDNDDRSASQPDQEEAPYSDVPFGSPSALANLTTAPIPAKIELFGNAGGRMTKQRSGSQVPDGKPGRGRAASAISLGFGKVKRNTMYQPNPQSGGH